MVSLKYAQLLYHTLGRHIDLQDLFLVLHSFFPFQNLYYGQVLFLFLDLDPVVRFHLLLA
jgi:hypothetical protein